MPEETYGQTNRWLTTLTIDQSKTNYKPSDIINSLEKENIESRPVWKPMHMQPLFKKYEYVHNLEKDVSRSLFNNGLCLPSGSSLKRAEQEKVINIILDCLNG